MLCAICRRSSTRRCSSTKRALGEAGVADDQLETLAVELAVWRRGNSDRW